MKQWLFITFFPILSGVGQGCPLSPPLFIICTETLAIRINTSFMVTGLSLFGNDIIIFQYAKDTALFIAGLYRSLT